MTGCAPSVDEDEGATRDAAARPIEGFASWSRGQALAVSLERVVAGPGGERYLLAASRVEAATGDDDWEISVDARGGRLRQTFRTTDEEVAERLFVQLSEQLSLGAMR